MNFKSISTIVLRDFSIGEGSSPEYILRVDGFKSGFYAWLMDKLGIKSREAKVTILKDSIQETIGKTDSTITNLSDVYSFNLEFRNNKVLLVLAVLTAIPALLGLYSFLNSLSELGALFEYMDFPTFLAFILLNLITISLPFFLYWSYKRSSGLIILLDQGSGTPALCIRIASGVTGKAVTKDDIEVIGNCLTSALSVHSRWFNTYYRLQWIS